MKEFIVKKTPHKPLIRDVEEYMSKVDYLEVNKAGTAEFENAIDTLDNKISANKSSINTLKNDVTSVKSRLNSVETSVSTIESRVGESEKSISQLDQKLSTISADMMIPITYSELKNLRDNSELIPGVFYRITDYQCTTTQENTRAMDHKFDIIVQALSSNTLSENASADYHYNMQAAPNIPAGTPLLIDDVIASNGVLVECSVIPYYYEYIDYGDGFEGLMEYKQADVFIAYDYLPNNDGKIVPVLYKTDMAGLGEDPDTDLSSPDYIDQFFYVGTATIDGVVYDKWRKIVDGSDLTWGDVGRIYLYTNVIIHEESSESSSLGLKPSVANTDGTLIDGTVVARYYIAEDGAYGGDNPDVYFRNDIFIEWGYAENDQGEDALVLYKTASGRIYEGADYSEPFYFVGTEYLDGVVYNKWRKIDGDTLTWGTDAKLYVFTDVITGDDTQVVPVIDPYFKNSNLPAWKLKYCLDNDTSRFTWADEENGTGVIYYMKDEHNNECPYDFKNIQFKRWAITGFTDEFKDNDDLKATLLYDENEQPVMYACKDAAGNVIPLSAEIDESIFQWCYTFTGYDTSTSLSQIEWYDMSTDRHKLSDELIQALIDDGCGSDIIDTCENNVISELTKEFLIDDYYDIGSLILNNIVFFSHFYDNGYDNGWDIAHCDYNTFGNDCDYNTFGDGCDYNTFGNDCHYNTFGDGCHYNTFGNKCCQNTFGNYCYYNTFGTYCNSNTFGNAPAAPISFVRYTRFDSGCCYDRLSTTTAGSTSQYIENVTVSSGVSGTSKQYRMLQVSRNAPPVVFEASGTTHIILD